MSHPFKIIHEDMTSVPAPPAPPVDLTIPPHLAPHWPDPAKMSVVARRQEAEEVRGAVQETREWIEDHPDDPRVVTAIHIHRLNQAYDAWWWASRRKADQENRDRRVAAAVKCPVCGEDTMRLSDDRRALGQQIHLGERQIYDTDLTVACSLCRLEIAEQWRLAHTRDRLANGSTRAELAAKLLAERGLGYRGQAKGTTDDEAE